MPYLFDYFKNKDYLAAVNSFDWKLTFKKEEMDLKPNFRCVQPIEGKSFGQIM